MLTDLKFPAIFFTITKEALNGKRVVLLQDM